MSAITVHIINIVSPTYQQVWQVREEVLRKPLGMSLKNEDLGMDANDTIFVAQSDDKVIGCVMLHHLNAGLMKLRQMAVYPEWQGKGIGKLLALHAEEYAREQNYKKIVLHARMIATDFYSKLGYHIVSNIFTEVGIPHVVMQKELS